MEERMKEHKGDVVKSWKDKYMKSIGHSPAWDDVRIIYRENNWKKENSKNHLE